ncbi:PEGA domain-containing protein [Deinococcus aquiradiocola]|uniref:PEGA domain-containing protein n=1 Tax=Deinococcus aquiradiocola TaxID=393059 RepID=A0A917P5V9_9DEIO|nr:PEGA domain-containing protein [Deinococcus aquiradiocola]GGJ62881.1 hypothetical protein GCM10008939_03400 [Deinococcus aquiradiocola]
MRLLLRLLLTGLVCLSLAACAPAALRVQPGVPFLAGTTFDVPRAPGGLFRKPGPSSVRVAAPAGLSVAVLLLPQGGPATLLQGRDGLYPLPVLSRDAALYTVASTVPLTFPPEALAGVRSDRDLGSVLEAATRDLPPRSYNVTTDDLTVRPFGQVQVYADPVGAGVRLDGRAVGNAPVVLDVPADTYRLTVVASGFVPEERTVRVQANGLTSVDVRLAPRPVTTGQLEVSSSVPAQVSVNGQPVGGTPASLTLDAGTYTVTVRAGTAADTVTVSVRAGATLRVRCTSAPGGLSCGL